LPCCEKMKNITVSLDDETYRRARIKAAELETSVSSLVRRLLTDLAAGQSEAERLKRQERTLCERITAYRAADRLTRDAVHDRGA
jgi:plasmid stability protein